MFPKIQSHCLVKLARVLRDIFQFFNYDKEKEKTIMPNFYLGVSLFFKA